MLCEAEADPQSKKSFLVLTTNFGEKIFFRPKNDCQKNAKKGQEKEKKGGRKGTKEDGKGREGRNNVDSNLGYFIDGWGYPRVERKNISKILDFLK